MAKTLLQQLDFSILQQCIHCGMCLPSCPTYVETHRERNSPRGRIALMRAVAENEFPLSREFAEEMNYCLGCLACTSSCPAGVDYGTLIETARSSVEEEHVVPGARRQFLRWAVMRQLFLRPGLFRTVAAALRGYQRSGLQAWVRRSGLLRLLPVRWRDLEALTPSFSPRFSDECIARVESPTAKRFRVALLTGCVQDVAFADVNRATADVLLENGCEVFTPRLQGCCGSLHAHNGDLTAARSAAQRLLDLIDPAAVDAIISNAGGCGSHLKHYGKLLADDAAYAERAKIWDLKVRDISEWLVEIGFRRPTAHNPDNPTTMISVTYHDACHLCHGQGITQQPRELLRSLPRVELRECAESTWCCGSAGIYALIHPGTASTLRERKWKNVEATGASIVAMGNPGCALHLQRKPGESPGPEIIHPVVLLARAYAAERARPVR